MSPNSTESASQDTWKQYSISDIYFLKRYYRAIITKNEGKSGCKFARNGQCIHPWKSWLETGCHTPRETTDSGGMLLSWNGKDLFCVLFLRTFDIPCGTGHRIKGESKTRTAVRLPMIPTQQTSGSTVSLEKSLGNLIRLELIGALVIAPGSRCPASGIILLMHFQYVISTNIYCWQGMYIYSMTLRI